MPPMAFGSHVTRTLHPTLLFTANPMPPLPLPTRATRDAPVFAEPDPVLSLVRGRLVALEGLDSGIADVVANRLAQSLLSRGVDVVVTREPAGTPLSSALHALILSHELDAVSEAVLLLCARRSLWNDVINPALSRGATVISMRFANASLAYGGAWQSLPRATLNALCDCVLESWQPDLTVWLGKASDGAGIRTSDAANAIALAPRTTPTTPRDAAARADYAFVDATGPVERVAEELRALVLDRFGMPATGARVPVALSFGTCSSGGNCAIEQLEQDHALD